MQPVAVEYGHRCISHSVCRQRHDASWHLKCGSGRWEELYNLWSHKLTSFHSVPMDVIQWIPGFPEVYDYRVALKNTEHFLCALYKHTKVNQLFEDVEGKSLTSVMNFCSKPNSIKELGCRLNVHALGELDFHASRGTSENLQFWVPLFPATCFMILLIDWKFKIWNSDAQRARNDSLGGRGCLLGHVRFSHGWREGPGKGLLNSY